MKQSIYSYYIYPIVFENKTRYIIWYEHEDDSKKDSVVLNDNNKLIIFSNIEHAINYDTSLCVKYDEEFLLPLNLDYLEEWINNPFEIEIKCDVFLNSWNLFTDLSRTINNNSFDRNKKKSNPLYEKILFGNNLPSLTPKNKEYNPTWQKEEIEYLNDILIVGLNLFKRVSVNSN